ncbi:RidA family protein [Labrys monachus]|uniref:Enamine deaminase RidA (YjgF/YER057c/UK114 family) n=1 Tax=Labrys monachus TaxID=217067 RepID=A0ABU0FE94_9HYPH|nr:RidA family protein [Labrys monachus]MDQ0392934.1 enamine deaminase RidA (YjgF/YER057c/UK114 family) [Labrys monachus]
MQIEKRIEELGLILPETAKVPFGIVLDFAWVRVFGDRVYVSGHGPQAPDGSVVGPFGKVGDEVSPEQAADAARLATLSVLGSLRRAIGDLDRIAAWLRVEGYVLAAPGFDRTTNVVNGASRLIVELFGEDRGRHARTAMGVAATPLNCPVVIAAELALKPQIRVLS